MWSKLFSLERQFHFYKSYHTNSINRKIHIVFIPILFFTFLVLFAEVPLPPPIYDLTNVIVFAYIGYCLVLDIFIGLLFTPFLVGIYVLSRAFRDYAGSDGTIPWALTINLLAWVAQFVGHYAFEGKSPALFDSLVQSVLAAPIVVWLEMLFSLGLLQDTKARLLRSRAAAQARKASSEAKDD